MKPNKTGDGNLLHCINILLFAGYLCKCQFIYLTLAILTYTHSQIHRLANRQTGRECEREICRVSLTPIYFSFHCKHTENTSATTLQVKIATWFTNLWSWWRCLLLDTDSESRMWFSIGGGSVRIFLDRVNCFWAIWKCVRAPDVVPFVLLWWWWCCCCWTVLFLFDADNGFTVALKRDWIDDDDDTDAGDNVDGSLFCITFSIDNNETLLTKYLLAPATIWLVATVDVSTMCAFDVWFEFWNGLLKFDCTWLTKYLLFNWFVTGGAANIEASFIDDIDFNRCVSVTSNSTACVVPSIASLWFPFAKRKRKTGRRKRNSTSY